MHLLTGFIVAALAKLRQVATSKDSSQRLKQVSGELRCEHVLPGRMRLRAAEAVYRKETFNKLTQQLETADNIKMVTTSFLTGSILIEYDDKTLDPELLYAIVYKLLGLENKEVDSHSSAGANRVFKSLDNAMLSATGGLIDFRSSALIGIGIYVAYKLLKGKTRTIIPGAFLGLSVMGSMV